jgi:peptidoglycan/LPS O-acetylase OafA/YrhL
VPLLRRLPAALGALLAWIGVAGIVASLVLIDMTAVGFPGPWAAAPTLATALALAGGVTAPPRALFLWTNPVAVVVGNASYSLYLWHFPVVVFAAALLPASPWSLPLTLAIVAVVGFASYAIIEQPLRYAPFLGGRVPATTAAEPEEPAVVASDAAAPADRRSRCGAAGADARDRDAASRGVAAGHALLPGQSADGGPERRRSRSRWRHPFRRSCPSSL